LTPVSFLTIPLGECSFLKDTCSIADFEIVRALTHDEGVFNTFEPLQQTSGSLTTGELGRFARVKLLKVVRRWIVGPDNEGVGIDRNGLLNLRNDVG